MAAASVVVVCAGVLLVPAIVAAADRTIIDVSRYSGDDRYSTSLEVALNWAGRYGQITSNAVLVSGESWTSAAVAVPLAAAVDGPLLLTPPNALRLDVAIYLSEAHIENVFVVAAAGEINARVFDELNDMGISTTLVNGDDRYTTGVAAAQHLGKAGEASGLGTTAIIANGDVFADALSAGQIASLDSLPVLLTPHGMLHPAVAEYLLQADIEHVILMGGKAAIAHAVKETLLASGVTTERISGEDRYGTAAAAANFALAAYDASDCYEHRVGLVRGDNPIDSFGAALLSGKICMPVLMTLPAYLPARTIDYLNAIVARAETDGVPRVEMRVFGGESAVAQSAIKSYILSVADPLVDSRCKPSGRLWDHTVGFPLAPWAVPSTGVLRITVLFMDFSDAQATHSTEIEYGLGIQTMENYLEGASYGTLDVEVVAHHKWIRASQPHSSYLEDLIRGRKGLASQAGRRAVRLADSEVDFSDSDIALVVFPSDKFAGANADGNVRADGKSMRMSRINTQRDEHPTLDDWGLTAAHEVAHNMGLVDLYPYDRRSLHPIPDVPRGRRLIAAAFGRMGLIAWFTARADDPRLQIVWEWPNGERMAGRGFDFEAAEMLAWSRFQLGWISGTQVRCITSPTETVTLRPIALPGDNAAMAVVPLSSHEVIVIESRRKLGHDTDTRIYDDDSGSASRPRLAAEGILVYVVDGRIRSGSLPIRVAGDNGKGVVPDYPLLALGESIDVSGYTITVTGNHSQMHTVFIERSN